MSEALTDKNVIEGILTEITDVALKLREGDLDSEAAADKLDSIRENWNALNPVRGC